MSLFYKFIITFCFIFVMLFSANADSKTNGNHILPVIMKLPPFYHQDRDEPKEERIERFDPLSVAIRRASHKHRPKGIEPITMQAALTTVAFKETALARNVAIGRCDKMPVGMRCDMKNGKPRARTYFQLWAVACPEVHDDDLEPGSQEELNIAAECAAKILTDKYNMCGSKNKYSPWAGAFSGYKDYNCNSPWAIGRAKYMRFIEAQLRREKYANN